MSEGHTINGHDAKLAHHFETPLQQFESSKLGMWLFLSTEIVLFGGLFCAYAIYRANHPEIFLYAHQFLDKTLGGINTLILIASSFTIAWSVRAAQLGQRKLLIGLLGFTLLCGCGFLGIKAVEYEHKWKHGLLWGTRYAPETEHGQEADAESHGEAAAGHEATETADAGTPPLEIGNTNPDRPLLGKAAIEPAGMAPTVDRSTSHAEHPPEPKNVQTFFGVYFAMTGLHGLHVIAGMVAIAWVLLRAWRGEFTPGYFAPVDSVALYWHLVDLIWIYLFPLLYLIH